MDVRSSLIIICTQLPSQFTSCRPLKASFTNCMGTSITNSDAAVLIQKEGRKIFDDEEFEVKMLINFW